MLTIVRYYEQTRFAGATACLRDLVPSVTFSYDNHKLNRIGRLDIRLGVKATTCKAKAKAKHLTFKAKAKDLILEDNQVGYQNEYKSATMSKFNC